MANPAQDTHATVEVDSHGGGHGEFNPMKVDGPMVFWTWVTFGLTAWVLHKYAWKPILAGLEAREHRIRKSVDTAAEIEQRLEEIKGTQDSMIAEADDKAKAIISEARTAAVDAAQSIEQKAREEATIVMENANRDIQSAHDKAQAMLKRESAEMAVSLAGKLLREKLTPETDRQLVDRLVKEI